MRSIVSIQGSEGAKGIKAQSIRDEVRQLWSRLKVRLNGRTESARVVGICSTFPGEGASTIAANLAIFLTEQGRKTCLVEANLRRAVLAPHFGVSQTSPGLAEFLDGTAHIEEVVRPEVVRDLALVPAGRTPSDIYGAFTHGAFGRFIEEVSPRAEVVVLDLPPLSESPESLAALPFADIVFLVVRAHQTHRLAVQRSVATLQELGVTIGGAIINRVRHKVPVFLDRLL